MRNLEQQLAEKEEELKYYETLLKRQCNECKDQDKISFAVEQLEKVKELLNTDFESIISWIDPYEDGGCLASMTYNHNNTIKIIDNQIEELKKEIN